MESLARKGLPTRTLIALGIGLTALSGCATYGDDVRKAEEQAAKDEYKAAQKTLKEALDKKGDDRLLYHLELGTVQHLAGKYEKSNRHLDAADRIANDLQTKRASEELQALMTSPRQKPYAGRKFERVYINYFSAMNYIGMARSADDSSREGDHIESARVELQQVRNLLQKISAEEISYEESEKKDEKLFTQLLEVYRKLAGEVIPRDDKLAFRGSAHARYILGTLYEKRGEVDNARIQYEKAAKLYENGYVDQYGLSGSMVDRAWMDTIRMMKLRGGYGDRVRRLEERKLNASQREQVDKSIENYNDKSHILVVQMAEQVPEPDELNLLVTSNPAANAFEIRPVLTGKPEEKLAQKAWFTLLYADKGILGMVKELYSVQLEDFVMPQPEKTIPLGPAWSVAKQTGLVDAVGPGIRATVPYYQLPLETKFSGIRVRVDNTDRGKLAQSESLRQLALQEQLRNADTDLQLALARTSFKNLAADKAGDAGGFAAELVGRLAAAGSSQAETRAWTMLPGEIHVRRLTVEPGTHTVSVHGMRGGEEVESASRQIDLEPGELVMWKKRFLQP